MTESPTFGKPVADQRGVAGEPLGRGGADVVLADGLQRGAAHEAHEHRTLDDADRERGQQQCAERGAGSSHPARGKPCAGSHPSHTANTTTSIMPAHTTGTAARVCAPTLSAVPSPRPRRIAESTPSGTLNSRAIVSAMMPSGTVTCAFSASSADTLDPVSSDEPRSPRNTPPIHSRYCAGSGWFESQSLPDRLDLLGSAVRARRSAVRRRRAARGG